MDAQLFYQQRFSLEYNIVNEWNCILSERRLCISTRRERMYVFRQYQDSWTLYFLFVIFHRLFSRKLWEFGHLIWIPIKERSFCCISQERCDVVRWTKIINWHRKCSDYRKKWGNEENHNFLSSMLSLSLITENCVFIYFRHSNTHRFDLGAAVWIFISPCTYLVQRHWALCTPTTMQTVCCSIYINFYASWYRSENQQLETE